MLAADYPHHNRIKRGYSGPILLHHSDKTGDNEPRSESLLRSLRIPQRIVESLVIPLVNRLTD
jgi:hypothetical protein